MEVDANKDYVEDYDSIGDGHVDEYDANNDGHGSNYMVAEQLLWPRGHWPRLSSNAIVDSRLHCALRIVLSIMQSSRPVAVLIVAGHKCKCCPSKSQ